MQEKERAGRTRGGKGRKGTWLVSGAFMAGRGSWKAAASVPWRALVPSRCRTRSASANGASA